MKTLARVGCLASALLSAGLMIAPPSWANASYQLTPSQVTLEPSGARSTSSFRVSNTGSEPVAIEVRMVERNMDLQGNETRPAADDDFVVYPPQVLLQPGQSQTVRVTWLGDPNPEAELAYRLITEQLPIQLNQPQQQVTAPTVRITALYNYVASVYVAPRGVSPDVVIESASHQKINGQDTLVVQFHNQGTARQLLSGLNLTLTSTAQPSATVTLGPDQLRGVSGENVLAQNRRQFTIPWPEGLPVGPVNATFTLR